MENFFYKLCPKGVIRVIGEDAVDYLQSQCSINLRKLDTGKIRYGLRLSTRGRVLGDSYFLRLDEEEFILLSKECEGADLLSLLNENIVADEVEFINESNAWELITVWKNGSGNVQMEKIGQKNHPRANIFMPTNLTFLKTSESHREPIRFYSLCIAKFHRE